MPSDYLEMLKVKHGVSVKLTNILLGIFGTGVGLFAYYFFGKIWLLVIGMFVIPTFMQLFLRYIVYRKIYYRNPSLFEMRRSYLQ